MKIEFVKSKGWWLVGAILGITIILAVVLGIHNKKHPGDYSLEFFQDEYVWSDYAAFVEFAKTNGHETFDFCKIEGKFNKQIDSANMDHLNVTIIKETYRVEPDTTYYLYRDFQRDSVWAEFEVADTTYTNINAYGTQQTTPLYDAVRKIKWNKKLDKTGINCFEVVGINGEIYYIFGKYKVRNSTGEILY